MNSCSPLTLPLLLSLQLRNIQNVIRLTKENLEALNAEFGKHQHPPSMYLQVSTWSINKSVLGVKFVISENPVLILVRSSPRVLEKADLITKYFYN
jgi:hypothetical protein